MEIKEEIANQDNSIKESAPKEEKKVKLLLLKQEKQKETDLELIDLLKIFAPGTSIRLALDDILRAGMGALIAVDNENLLDIAEGGFKINCRFNSQKLVELAKMDGAIILSNDMKKILYANTMLVPDIGVLTRETGTRHKSAERTARQMKAIVIAVSERKNKITLYYKDIKYELEASSEILRRAAENLQILEKQKEIFNDLLSNLNILEINNLVTTSDVCSVLQRFEMMKRISSLVKKHLVELGKEGIVVSMRMKELTRNLNKEEELILKDYFGQRYTKVGAVLDNMNFDFLLEIQNISRLLFDELYDKPVFPRGIRMLSKTNILEKDLKTLISNLKNLEEILNADEVTLLKVLKKKDSVLFFNKELKTLKEKIMVGKKI
ncbi:MAG: DNA integrity scanning diadenylate cyclase DisA [Nanoarchaeota archaeon]|nr:DNA integrity scanning diadenylate cyclase DisA [Nanoarchaeota archaeon]